MKILLKIFLIVICPLILFSQQINNHKPSEKIIFEHIDEEDGLSNNNITCLFQDSKGFIWIGTVDGLNKYDGHTFVVYRQNPNNLNSIIQNRISTIFEDSSGNLWIATKEKNRKGWLKSSLCLYDREKDQFKSFINNPKDSLSIKNSYITNIVEDDSNYLLIATKSGVMKFEFNTKVFKTLAVDEKTKRKINLRTNILYKLNSNKREFLVGTDKGLLKITEFEKNYLISKLLPSSKLSNLNGKNILSICEDRFNNIWIGTLSGDLYKYDKVDNNLINYNDFIDIKNNIVFSLLSDNKGEIWIGTRNGLFKYKEIDDSFIHYANNPNDPNSLTFNKVKTIFQDNSGVIWLGTAGGGVNLINLQYSLFRHYSANNKNNNSLSDNRIWSIYQDNNKNFWIGTNRGLNKFDLATETFNLFITKYYDKNLNNDRITAINSDKNGNLWFGTRGGGLNKFNPISHIFKRFQVNKKNKNGLVNNRIRKIYKDSDGMFWIGTSGGLNKFNPIQEKFIKIDNDYANFHLLKDKTITAIHESMLNNERVMWFGTHGRGLYSFNRSTNEISQYKNDPNDSRSISNNYIWSIYQDQTGTIWCSTYGGLNKLDDLSTFKRYKFDPDTLANDVCKVIFESKNGAIWIGNNHGLYKYDRKKDIFILYAEKYKIPKTRIDSIVEDENGCLWICFDKKIVKFNPKTSKSIIYKIQYSLNNHVQIPNPSLKSKNGNILCGGQNGFILFDPAKIKENEVIPNISFTDFKIFNKSVGIKKSEENADQDTYLLDKHISETEVIKIPYDMNVFSIEFAALDYRDPMKNKYLYKLDGVDPDWVETDASRRFATYNQLNPGEYTFFVKGSNNDGVWNEEARSLKIIITPLWWQTSFFKLFILFIIVGSLVWLYFNRINALKKKHQLQAEFSRRLVESQELDRKRIATALHDGHGQNLLVISNEMQYFTKVHKEYKQVLNPVTEIVQESIDEIRNIAYTLHPHQLDKLGLTKTIKSMIQKVSGSSDIHFTSRIDEIDDLFEKNIEINVYRILQEAVNNIVRHSEATESKLSVSKSIDFVEIMINDNGNGFKVEEKLQTAKGLGLSGIYERVNLIRGEIKIVSQPEFGTTINIKVPIKK